MRNENDPSGSGLASSICATSRIPFPRGLDVAGVIALSLAAVVAGCGSSRSEEDPGGDNRGVSQEARDVAAGAHESAPCSSA
ncbi:hypothetical protein GHK92_10835 [Nocardioides sp. dk4132]|uniref:hypothetical protein n=1 Tax=Nocardioides sp. dk4132 TaxID=2662433 RepID=UPI001296D4A5|nr:hypothetical protein [Nocardioides sp. dk4132]MQW76373.1 hypothetical protein [Nocardioides sp. dk4132]